MQPFMPFKQVVCRICTTDIVGLLEAPWQESSVVYGDERELLRAGWQRSARHPGEWLCPRHAERERQSASP